MKKLVSRQWLVVGLTIALSAALFSLAVPPRATFAATCGSVDTSIISGDACSGASTDENNTDSSKNPIISVLTFVMQVLTGAVGVAAIGALVYAGIMYSSAGGESGQVQKAKTIIKDTVIGIVCYAGMILILNFVIPGGVFGQQSTTGGGTSASPGNGSGTTANTGNGSESTTPHGGDVTAATYNIRTTNGNRWDSTRANSILSYLKTVDIAGVQEGKTSTDSSKDSIGWLTSKLGSAGYLAYAEAHSGEYRAVFWKKEKFTLLDKGNYKIDGNRNLVWVKLQHKSTGTAFYFLTTHLDYNKCKHQYGVDTTKDCVVRATQAASIAKYISSHMGSTPVVLVGDMNSQPGSDVYKTFLKNGLKNAYDIATKKISIRSSIIDKFNGGTSGTFKTGGKPIDHVYVKNGISIPRIEVKKHKGSDHVPVEADLSLPGGTGS